VFFVLCANNINTDISIEGISTRKESAWTSMYAAFLACLEEASPNIALPGPEDAKKGWEADNCGITASITEDGASIYNGDDLTYYFIAEHHLPLYELVEDYCDSRTMDSSITVFLGEDAAMKALRNKTKRMQDISGMTVRKGKKSAHFDDGESFCDIGVKPLDIFE
jgi:hypothetical protein